MKASSPGGVDKLETGSTCHSSLDEEQAAAVKRTAPPRTDAGSITWQRPWEQLVWTDSFQVRDLSTHPIIKTRL